MFLNKLKINLNIRNDDIYDLLIKVYNGINECFSCAKDLNKGTLHELIEFFKFIFNEHQLNPMENKQVSFFLINKETY